MSVVLRSDFENVKAQLEDTQESLAAAFARIEVFRQREKLLLAEIAKLRTAQPVAEIDAASSSTHPQQESSTSSSLGGSAGTQTQQQHQQQQGAEATDKDGRNSSISKQDQQQQPPWPMPCYITEVEGALPVLLIGSSGRRTPGSIVITPEYVDFVEVRARIKRHAFIGIASAPVKGSSAHKGSSSGLKLKHLLPSCMSPSNLQLASSPPAGGNFPLKGPGMAQLVQGPGSSNHSNKNSSSNAAGAAWMAENDNSSNSTAWPPQPPGGWSSSIDNQQQQRPRSSPSGSPSHRSSHSGTAAVAAGGTSPPHHSTHRFLTADSVVACPGASSPYSPRATTSSGLPSVADAAAAAAVGGGAQQEEPSGWGSPQARSALRHCPTWHAGRQATDAADPSSAAAAVEAELTEAGAAAAGAPSSPRSSGSSGGLDGSSATEARGVWKILWRGGGMQQQLAFEATLQTREILHRHTARWLGEAETEADELSQLAAAAAGGSSSSTAATAAATTAGSSGTAAPSDGSAELSVPRHLTPGGFFPRLSEPSAILISSSSSRYSSSSIGSLGSSPVPGGCGSAGISPRSTGAAGFAASAAPADSSSNAQQQQQLVAGVAHIAAALPVRYQSRDWVLLYSTARHGISLQTLYRRAAGQGATVLLVRDGGGYVFGAFCPETWRPSPRFFGTGETFVFQLAPHKVMWPWKLQSQLKNDFFMYAQPDGLGIGGLGAFAIWLDGELLHGSSGSCGTFGSPCLASKDEFKVAVLELWALQ